MVRADDLDGYFSAVSCFGGRGFAHAYVSKEGHGNHMDILKNAIHEWNTGSIEIYEGGGKRIYKRETGQKEE